MLLPRSSGVWRATMSVIAPLASNVTSTWTLPHRLLETAPSTRVAADAGAAVVGAFVTGAFVVAAVVAGAFVTCVADPDVVVAGAVVVVGATVVAGADAGL